MKLIEQYLSYLRHEKNYSSHTEISYSTDLTQFSDFLLLNCEGVDLSLVDGDHFRQWIVYLIDSGVSARSVNRKLSALKSFYRFLLKTDVITSNPTRKLVGPKSKKTIPSFVNNAQMEAVLDSELDEQGFESFRNRVIIELFYVTGMRRAELIGLRNVDVDLVSDIIKVTGKRNKQRLIPFSGRTKELILSYVQQRDNYLEVSSPMFFARKGGEALYPMLVHRIVCSSLKWIPTLAKVSPHVLRHSFATGMLNNGAEINAVKELLGHSSLASTEVYTHTSFEELKKIYTKAHPRA